MKSLATDMTCYAFIAFVSLLCIFLLFSAVGSHGASYALLDEVFWGG